ncbi:CDP-alcohol phosphatidyltransferase family protein [Candidatus Roizmanbacteria bacterium]|nr:CDP-alcohol phosphatidyltransferase family protein [Candidatus Roizmanbacteria bacterium]
MLSTLKPIATKNLQPIARLFKNVNPNYITLMGMIFPILFFICILYKLYIPALFVFIFNSVDMLDGMVARSHNKVTPFGGFLDSTIDRFSDYVVLIAFSFGALVPWIIVAPLVLLTYLISYIRSRTELAAQGKLVADVGIIERTERLFFVFIALLLYVMFPSLRFVNLNIISLTFIILILLSAVTVFQRIYFAYKRL